jgi:hypothetical protein
MTPIPHLLETGIKQAELTDQTARLVLSKPEWLPDLLDCLGHSDPAIQKRAADALKKAAKQKAELLQAHKNRLLTHLWDASIPQVQWHLCQTLALLDIEPPEFRSLRPHLLALYRHSASRVVQASALTALVKLSLKLEVEVEEGQALIREALQSKFPAVAARARHLNALFTNQTRPTWW